MSKKLFILPILLVSAGLAGCGESEISTNSLPGYISNGTMVNISGEMAKVSGYDTCPSSLGCVIFYGSSEVPVIVVGSDDVPRKEIWEVELVNVGHKRMRVTSRRIVYRDGRVEKL